MYELEQPLVSKMNIIVQKIYGGEEVEVPEDIAEKIRNFEKQVRILSCYRKGKIGGVSSADGCIHWLSTF